MITGKSAARSFQRNVGDWPKTMCRQKLRNAVPEAGKPALSCSRSMGLTFPLRSSLSVLRNRASRINGPAISPHVDCSLLRGSTALTALGLGCKPCARPAMRTIIGRFGCVVDRIICRLYIADFTSALPPKADSTRTSRHVGFVPGTDSCAATNSEQKLVVSRAAR
jgi:hypothetical protein